jgi:heme/copper-type cytochrome/quinol oxidase subunit 4
MRFFSKKQDQKLTTSIVTFFSSLVIFITGILGLIWILKGANLNYSKD